MEYQIGYENSLSTMDSLSMAMISICNIVICDTKLIPGLLYCFPKLIFHTGSLGNPPFTNIQACVCVMVSQFPS